MSEQIISKDGYKKLQDELELLSKEKRREIADRIQKAKDMGDLSENAEYAEAKDAQAFNEGRISEVNFMLKTLKVVEEDADGSQGVILGSEVHFTDGKGKEKIYTIVSFNEVDPAVGKISNESPIGQAFIGKNNGDTVTVNTPRGENKYKITKIV